MQRPSVLWVIPALAAILLLVPAAASAQPPTAPITGPLAAPGSGGDVFTMTNSPTGNHVLAYRISTDGVLLPAGSFGARGLGTGASLADQGALALADQDQFLLVVDAGSHAISVFRVNTGATGPLLTYVHQVYSGGVTPVSLTVHGSLVYVVNAGDATHAGGIAGFWLSSTGALTPISGSRQPLSSTASVGPAEISFNPSGHVLVVTEEDTNKIDTYTVGATGVAHAPVVTPSNGTTPYGFAWGRGGTLVVSDAASGALSSYSVAATGALTVVSGTVVDGGLAPCWVAVTHNGEWAFTSNAHGNTISSYLVGSGGQLTLNQGLAATTGTTDTDLAVAGSHGQYLYVVDVGAGEIQEFHIGAHGALTAVSAVLSLPATTEGLAAF